VNAVSRRSKQYQRACQLLRVTQYLQTAFFVPCVVEDFDDDGVTLRPLQLPHVKRSQRRITYSSLSLSNKPHVRSLITRRFDFDSTAVRLLIKGH